MLALFMAYFLLLATTCGYAIWRGGRDGQLASSFIGFGSLLTFAVTQGDSRVPLLVLDLAVFGAYLALALRSSSYWPLWMAGFQLITVAEGIASLLAPATAKGILHAVTGFWSIPMLLVMTLGIFLDSRGFRRADAGPGGRAGY